MNWSKKPKILYAFQGTGNGHASRASVLIPILQQYAEVKVLCSGTNRQLDLPFSIDYQLEGISFYYNKQGGLDYGLSLRKARFLNFYKELKSLNLDEFDLILNDFEPVSAYAAKKQKKRCIGLSHQAAFLSRKSPRPPKKHAFAEWVFRHYAPSKHQEAFHFERYDDFIHPAIIRPEIQAMQPSNKGYFVVYLPAYSEKSLKEILTQLSNKEWLIFSKECEKSYRHRNLNFVPIGSQAFMEALKDCEGLLCSAGFEAPAEALYLGKKLFVIPIKGQYEQDCNAEALKRMGVATCKNLNQNSLKLLQDWVYQENPNFSLELSDPERFVRTLLAQYLAINFDQKILSEH